jgi:acid phosphatase type 7
MSASSAPASTTYPECVEHGVWVAIPNDPPDNELCLKLKEVDPNESRTVKERGVISFHTLGCSGYYPDQEPGKSVATAMATQVGLPGIYGGASDAAPASFLFHLGDISYKDEDPANPAAKDQATIYNAQFYAQYAAYRPSIFAIPGNHDGKESGKDKKSAIAHFLQNFCDPDRKVSPDNKTDHRKAMCQPYPYWRLETAVASIIGLYTNDINGGQLDDPMGQGSPQYQWLVETLSEIKATEPDKAVVIALHYPPYSGGANFKERGDPNLGPTPRKDQVKPLAALLQDAYRKTNLYPDLVLSAHAHLYQRIIYQYSDGRQIPHLIVGNGGHPPLENLFETCNKTRLEPKPAPLDLVLPEGFSLLQGDTAKVVGYNDTEFGFVRITIDHNQHKLTGEFFAVCSSDSKNPVSPRLADSFVLDLSSKRIAE